MFLHLFIYNKLASPFFWNKYRAVNKYSRISVVIIDLLCALIMLYYPYINIISVVFIRHIDTNNVSHINHNTASYIFTTSTYECCKCVLGALYWPINAI